MAVLGKRVPLVAHLGIHAILVGSYASVNQMTPVCSLGNRHVKYWTIHIKVMECIATLVLRHE